MPLAILEVGSPNVHNSGIIQVVPEIFAAKGKKGWVGQTIILQNNAHFYLPEKPGDGRTHGVFAA